MSSQDDARGRYWERGVSDWAEIQEPLQRPLYDALLDALELRPGSTLLDAGSGVVCVLAMQRGFDVTGLDASPMFIDVARRRCPRGRFFVGDLNERLPFDDSAFDAVVFSNSLQFVSSAGETVREAARVLRPGGRMAIAVFDAPEKCDGHQPVGAILALLPPAPAGSPGPFALSSDETLERLVRDAGLEFEGIQRVETPWHYPDLETARRAFMSAGPSHKVIEMGREAELTRALDAASEPFHQPDGTFLLQNVFKFVMGQRRRCARAAQLAAKSIEKYDGTRAKRAAERVRRSYDNLRGNWRKARTLANENFASQSAT